MTKMELTNSETVEKSTITFCLEIQLSNFSKDPKKVSKSKKIKHTFFKEDYEIHLDADVHPKGYNNKAKSYLVVLPRIGIHNENFSDRKPSTLACIVNVIDVDGNSRFPKSFEKLSSDDSYIFKYLRRAIILDKANELLPNDVLTIRCDFCLDFTICFSLNTEIKTDADLWKFLNTIPQTYFGQNGLCSVFDFTRRILTLPRFHESRKRFGVYGIPLATPHIDFDPGVDKGNILDHFWIFDTKSDRFLLLLDDNRYNVGFRLMDASPVIKQLVNATMTDQKEQRIHLPNVSTRTFIDVLYFLESKCFCCTNMQDFSDIEQMCDLYKMRRVRDECVEEMQKIVKYHKTIEKEERIIDFYSDEYLSNIWDSRRYDYECLMRFLNLIPHAYCSKNIEQTVSPNDLDTENQDFAVYDLTSKVLDLPQFHEMRKRFGVYGIPPSSSATGSELKEKDLEHVWIFDTCPDRFLLSLDESEDGIGSRLLKMSSVIKQLLNSPWKQSEKRIDLSHLNSLIFINVLYFLENDKMICSEYREFFDIYKMAHLYDIKELQIKSAEEMVKSLVYLKDFFEVEKLINLYSDENLKALFHLRRLSYRIPWVSTPLITQVYGKTEIEDLNSVFSSNSRKDFTVYDYTRLNSESESICVVNTFNDRLIFFYEVDSDWNHYFMFSRLWNYKFKIREEPICRYWKKINHIVSNISSRTFKNVFYFLDTRHFISLDFRDILDMYKMSHLYGMHSLQSCCSEEMVKRCKSLTDLETAKRIANIFLDNYLLKLLEFSGGDIEISTIPKFSQDGRSNFESYM